MRRFLMLLVCVLPASALKAQFRGVDVGGCIGGSALYPIINDDRLGFGVDLAAKASFGTDHFFASAGLGSTLLSEDITYFAHSAPSVFDRTVTISELFFELPVGVSGRIIFHRNSIVLGTDYLFLFSPAGAGQYSMISPHIDFLFANGTRKSVATSGLFLKGMFAVGKGNGEYTPFFLGIGYKGYLKHTSRMKRAAAH